MELFQQLPNELKGHVFSFLPLRDMLNLRLVSSQWKALVASFYTHLTCHLSDDSYPYAMNTTEIFETLKVSNFTRASSKPISSTRGAGSLIANAGCLHLIGSRIDENELKKIMRYAGNISKIWFTRTTLGILKASLGSKKHKFLNITSLTIEFLGPPNQTQNKCLILLGSLIRSSLPEVAHLALRWIDQDGPTVASLGLQAAGMVLSNYLYTIRIILTLQKTLKFLEISRGPRINSLLAHSMVALPLLIQQESDLTSWTQDIVNECTELLKRVQLTKLNLSLLNAEGVYPCLLESCLLQAQSSIRELHVTKKCTRMIARPSNPASLENLLPQPPSKNLTIVTLSFSNHRGGPLQFCYFSGCPYLKTLVINCFCDQYFPEGEWICKVSEFEQLPKSLERLQLIPPREDRVRENAAELMETCIILDQSQVEWLASGKLPNLRYFGGMLLLAIQRPERPFVRVMRNLWNVLNLPLELRNNATHNVDMNTFKRLVNLSRITHLQFNMVCVDEFGGWDGLPALNYFSMITSMVGVDRYLAACRNQKGVTSVESSLIRYRYAEVSIKKYN